jgi:hypothetical protein
LAFAAWAGVGAEPVALLAPGPPLVPEPPLRAECGVDVVAGRTDAVAVVGGLVWVLRPVVFALVAGDVLLLVAEVLLLPHAVTPSAPTKATPTSKR